MSTLTEYAIHPAAEIFPMMDRVAFEGLKRDIDEHGVKECITIFEDRIIDGRNRYKAMLELGIDPACHAAELERCDNPIAYVLSLNLHRRHLNETQRATIAAKIANMKEGRPSKDTPQICGVSTGKASEMLSVGTRTVESAKHAIDKGASSVVAAMECGELPASVAAKFVDVVTDKTEQTKIVKKGTDAVKAVVKEAKQEKEKPDKTRDTGESKPERAASNSQSYFAQFRALWDKCDATGRAAIVTFVTDYVSSR